MQKITLFLFLILSITLGCSSPKKITTKSLQDQPFDAIIVPGCPFEEGEWSSLMKIRVYWAKYLYDQGYAKNIIFSGSAVYSPYYESKIMEIYALKLGIDANNIFLDNKAEHSTENVFYSLKVAKSNGFENVGLSTDPFQSRMLQRFIRKRKLKVKHLPIDFDILEKIDMKTPIIEPKSAFCDTFVSLTERESWRERWRGTRGKHINWDK
jgi:uncharacterized SAM-binding protein YcdF (DUF218 family)